MSKILKFRRVFASGNGKPKTVSEKDQSSAKEEENPHTTTTEAQKLSFTPDGRRYALPDPNVLGIRGAENPPGRILQALKHSLLPVERPAMCDPTAYARFTAPRESKLFTCDDWSDREVAHRKLDSNMEYVFCIQFPYPLQQPGVVGYPIMANSVTFTSLEKALKWTSKKLLYLLRIVLNLKHGGKAIVREIKVQEGFIMEFDNAARGSKSGAWKCARLSLNDERGFWCFDLHKIGMGESGKERGPNLDKMSVQVNLWKDRLGPNNEKDFEATNEDRGVCDAPVISMSDNIGDLAYEAQEEYLREVLKRRLKPEKPIAPLTVKRRVDGDPKRWAPMGDHVLLEC